MDSKKITPLTKLLNGSYLKENKTTTIALVNVLFFLILTVLFIKEKINADDYAIALAAGTSAITSILGYFTKDES